MKYTLSGYVEPTARRLAEEMNLELVDVELAKENTGKFLRFTIDTPEGVDLDALEKFHRAVQPLMDNVEYDDMEVTSPGADRPLKKPADFERAAGLEVEVKLYRAVEGSKYYTGTLAGLENGEVVIDDHGTLRRFAQSLCAQVAPLIEVDEREIDEALGDVFEEDGEDDEFEPEDNYQPEDN